MRNLALKFRLFQAMVDLKGRGESVERVTVTALGREMGQGADQVKMRQIFDALQTLTLARQGGWGWWVWQSAFVGGNNGPLS